MSPVAWSADSQLLVSAAWDGTVGLWFVADSAHTLELARKRVRTELSDEQRVRYRLPTRR
jgi:WD40 repeat protein